MPFSMGIHSVLLLSSTLIALSRASTVDDATKYSKENVKDIDADLLKLAAIPSISSLPEHARDIVAASEWLIEKLKAAGLEAKWLHHLRHMSLLLCHDIKWAYLVIRSGRACAERQAFTDKGTTFSVR